MNSLSLQSFVNYPLPALCAAEASRIARPFRLYNHEGAATGLDGGALAASHWEYLIWLAHRHRQRRPVGPLYRFPLEGRGMARLAAAWGEVPLWYSPASLGLPGTREERVSW